MALTTSDELKKQLTVIFGSKTGIISPEIEVGDIIGIGKISVKRTEVLIKKTLNFLYAYNAMLRDYAGCRLYSIEFGLENIDPKDEGLSIMPKSMLLIPGEFKDCINILLLLSPEMRLMDNKKAKDSVNHLGELYFEVEEAINRPEIERIQQQAMLSKFAHRFALKLQGKVIEGKWNKKLVGMKDNGEETRFKQYLSANLKKKMKWDDKQIIPSDFKFRANRLSLKPEEKFEFLKEGILDSTFQLILKNTFKLTSNLFKIANTGTVDDLQNQLLILMMRELQKYLETVPYEITIENFKKSLLKKIVEIRENLNLFRDLGDEFCKKGLVLPVNELTERFGTKLKEYTAQNLPSNQKEFLINLSKVSKKHLSSGKFDHPNKVRSMEFKPILLYIRENAKVVYKKLKDSIPNFSKYYVLHQYAKKLLKAIYNEFEGQKKPVRTLGQKYIKKFAQILKNKIEENCCMGKEKGDYYSKFKDISQGLIDTFINDIEIEIEDLMGFVEIMHANDQNLLNHIEKISSFPKEIEFLSGLILRSSSLQRFLKDIPNNKKLDPATFVDLFSEFLKRRLSAFRFNWKGKIIEWLNEYKRRTQPKYDLNEENDKKWPQSKVIEEFLNFLSKKISDSLTLEGFKKPLNDYIQEKKMNIENRQINEIYKSYEMSLDLIEQVPDYIHQVFLKVIEEIKEESFSNSLSSLMGSYPTIDSLFSDFKKKVKEMSLGLLKKPEQSIKNRPFWEEIEELFELEGLYEFVLENEMKYFSKLFARPMRVTLKTDNQNKIEKEHELTHVIEFKYFKKLMRATVSVDMDKFKAEFTNSLIKRT